VRHLYANAVTWALAIGLALFAALFAWARSAQLVIATELDVEPVVVAGVAARVAAGAVVGATPDAGDVERAAFGEQVYIANCRNCHTADGSGRGMYPPVRDLALHLDAEGGRDYLIDLTLHGLHTGEYGAPMPPMPELSDARVAAVLNHTLVAFATNVEAPDPRRLYTPAEVTARRGLALDEREVAATRPPIPSAEALGSVGAGEEPGGAVRRDDAE